MDKGEKYIRVVSILLAVSLLCSACGTQEAGKQSLSATGAAILTPSAVETETPAGIEEEDIEDQKPVKTTQKDKDGTVWDISREVTVEQDGYTYHAYLSKEGKESWIYQADSGSDSKTTLSFPEEIQGAVLTKLGRTPVEDDYYDIFGNSVEPYHDVDAWEGGKENVEKVICPPSVKKVMAAAFCGFRNLEEVVLPEHMQKFAEYILFSCLNLKKIVLPLSPDFTESYVAMARCNSIEKVELPEGSRDYCVKDGMLLSKDKKTLYQVFVTGETVVVPEGITRVATKAINATHITKIRSVRLPSTLKKLDDDAILDEGDYHMSETNRIKSVRIARNNPFLAQENDCIYYRATGTLAVIVGTKKSMTLPEGVRYISDVHSQVGKEIERLVIPASFKAFKTNQCLVKGINIGSEGAVEFLSATPPGVEKKGKKMPLSAGCFLIVPKEGVKAYKRWYKMVENPGEKLSTIIKGDRACIIEKYFESELVYKKLMKKYGF